MSNFLQFRNNIWLGRTLHMFVLRAGCFESVLYALRLTEFNYLSLSKVMTILSSTEIFVKANFSSFEKQNVHKHRHNKHEIKPTCVDAFCRSTGTVSQWLLPSLESLGLEFISLYTLLNVRSGIQILSSNLKRCFL